MHFASWQLRVLISLQEFITRTGDDEDLPCVARLPCPPPVISFSPFCPLLAVAVVLQTPKFVRSLPPSVYVHAPSTEM